MFRYSSTTRFRRRRKNLGSAQTCSTEIPMKFCESGLRLRRKRFKKPIANLRKRLHPDLNPGNTEAEEKFKEIASAYGLVGDAENREAFDNREIDAGGAGRPRRAITKTTHPRSAQAQANRRGHDLEFRLLIEFVDSIAAANKRLTLPDGGTLDVTIRLVSLRDGFCDCAAKVRA